MHVLTHIYTCLTLRGNFNKFSLKILKIYKSIVNEIPSLYNSLVFVFNIMSNYINNVNILTVFNLKKKKEFGETFFNIDQIEDAQKINRFSQ